MKAVVLTRYGPPEVLELWEVDKPAPKDNEILIRIRATTVTKGDCEVRSMTLPGWIRPLMQMVLGFGKPRRTLIFGMELAGEVEAVGKDVTKFKPGDPVFGSAGLSFGTHAEYICLPEEGAVAIKPANMTYEEAATVPFGGRDALHFLRLAQVRPGESMLINGAGGSIGTYAVQLAKLDGAVVTAVDSADKLDMLRETGADKVIDFREQDFTRNGEFYDVILDAVGGSHFDRCMASLKPGGRYLLANPRLSDLLRASWAPRRGDKRVIAQTASGTTDDLTHLRALIEAGRLRAVIDRIYSLEQIVEAHRYVETGQKKGNVAISVGS